MARDRITLRLRGDVWEAQWSGPHVAKVVQLFGGDTLPTPFTAQAEPAKVFAAVKAKNPAVEVVLEL